MSLHITQIEPATNGQWQQMYDRCDYATYFHSPGWADVWREYSNGCWRPQPLQVVFSDGCEAIVILARSCDRPASHVTSFVGTFGGWISVDPLSLAHGELLQQVLIGTPNLVWRINPYDRVALGLSRPDERRDHTMAIDLRGGAESLVARWRGQTMMRAVRKATRAGLQTRRAETAADWRAYFELYQLSLDRWGDRVTSRYDWPLFESLMRQPSSSVKLWLVEAERPVAGAVVCYARRNAIYWHGAADASWFPHRPANLLMHDVILDASARDLWWFDFNPSGSHEGVASFKRHCGGTPLSSPVVFTGPEVAVAPVPERVLA